LNAQIIDKRVKFNGKTVFCGDSNATYVTFECEQFCDGIDLASLTPFIKFSNSLGGYSKLPLSVTKSGEKLLLDWLIGAEATVVCGELECQIVFESEDESVILNTKPFYVTVENSVKDCGVGVNIKPNQMQLIHAHLQEEIDGIKYTLQLVDQTNAEQDGKIEELSSTSSENTCDTYVFDSLTDAIEFLKAQAKWTLKTGDVIRIRGGVIPHLWISEAYEWATDFVDYTVEAIKSDIARLGYCQIGYYKLNFITAYAESEESLETVVNINASCTDEQIPTAKSVYSMVSSQSIYSEGIDIPVSLNSLGKAFVRLPIYNGESE